MADPLRRRPELRLLSTEHHHALVLAFRLKTGLAGQPSAGAPTNLADLVEMARQDYQSALVPHFRTEEETILPLYLRHAPEDDPRIARLLLDHVALHRHLLDAATTERPEAARRASLQAFAERLEAHVRFEERDFFEAVQSALTDDELTLVEAGSKERALPVACGLGGPRR